ncbi:hypothetical protein BCR35DRAFT_334175 [Leucosporidium creatinivorum]|uniref:MARVEL domain-containing protein n=1 Tax=Leucosporidium creatinivorum TaxID=106004 RepID=A0A1Y2EGV2_9BASI|nr:hypothetical protein BCR35DRAFT_334175 [Leucosporidium creatinivorum]
MALLATFCFSSFCATAILLGLLVVPLIAGSFLLNAIIWGIVWIMALVEASGLVVALSHNNCSRVQCNALGTRCVRVRCGLFHSQEGVAWVVCWLSFFLLIVVIWSWATRKEDEEVPSPIEPPPAVSREEAAMVEPEQPQMPQTGAATV